MKNKCGICGTRCKGHIDELFCIICAIILVIGSYTIFMVNR